MEFYRVLVYENELDEMLQKIEQLGEIKSVLHNGDKYYIVYQGKEMED